MVVANSQRILSLVGELLRHSRLYEAGRPEITDHQYDALEDELRALSPRHPFLERVGKTPDARKANHSVPMLSLQKTYEIDDLLSWMGTRKVAATPKIDGVSLSLVFSRGELVQAKTRGNGEVGEDVTEKIRWVGNIPAVSEDLEIEVRGELVCETSRFLSLAEEMEGLGLDRPNSARNIVAGLLGRKDHASLMRHLSFIAFSVVGAEEIHALDCEDAVSTLLVGLGFDAAPSVTLCGKAELEYYISESMNQEPGERRYAIDGLVFSYSSLAEQRAIGETSHHPRYKIAFKWQSETAETRVVRIDWFTSRFGVVTPVAVVEPVALSGASISNVTLHNFAHVRDNNVKTGDVIEIVRSGEVIPKFLRTLDPAPGIATYPATCPSCGGGLLADEGAVRLICTAANCTAQIEGKILHWIESVGIEDLNEKRLSTMVEAGLVRSCSDLYRLDMEKLMSLPKTKEKMAAKLLASIDASKRPSAQNFLCGLGIVGAGANSWEKLLDVFGSLEALRRAKKEEILKIPGFAEKTSSQIVSGLMQCASLVEDLFSVGVAPEDVVKKQAASANLDGKSFVITGALSQPRSHFETLIKAAGGKISGSVSAQTYALVTDDPSSTSSKMKKARELGVKVMSEAELLEAVAEKGT